MALRSTLAARPYDARSSADARVGSSIAVVSDSYLGTADPTTLTELPERFRPLPAPNPGTADRATTVDALVLAQGPLPPFPGRLIVGAVAADPVAVRVVTVAALPRWRQGRRR
ncbi:hypothetical protein [Micromonospora sp. NPDC005220]|uniref:hypothetical protein n=1 Tax=Micromonospora sp. NPDC005220 TaxID=3155589 RepID=UPI0033AD83F1